MISENYFSLSTSAVVVNEAEESVFADEESETIDDKVEQSDQGQDIVVAQENVNNTTEQEEEDEYEDWEWEDEEEEAAAEKVAKEILEPVDDTLETEKTFFAFNYILRNIILL